MGAVSVSAAGLVAYRTGGASRRQLAWFDRSGKALGTMGAPDENDLSDPRISPDGRRVVGGPHGAGQRRHLASGRRRARAGSRSMRPSTALPIWSPDGSRIVFDSNRKGARDLYQKPSSGAGARNCWWNLRRTRYANDWSADGRFILYHSLDPQTDGDLWVVPMEGDRRAVGVPEDQFDERHGQFSPDGRWVAYKSNESGRNEIYIRPFVAPASGRPARPRGGQWQVSTAGGIYPRWRPDGKELYYIGPNGEMMAAPITDNGDDLEPGAPVALFPTRIYGGGADMPGRQYDVPRRPLPDQHGPGRCGLPHHADPKLEPRSKK